MRCLLIPTLLLLVACSTAVVRPRQQYDAPTLLVVNGSMEPLRIYDGLRLLGTIYPGRTECLTLWSESTNYLLFRQPSTTEHGPEFTPVTGEGWEVRIHHRLRMDVLSLQPAEPCGG